MSAMEIKSLWGEEFNIVIPSEQDKVKKITKKVKEALDSSDDNATKQIKSDKVSLEDKLIIIKENVLRILGKHADNILVIRDAETFHDYISQVITKDRLNVDTETNNTTNSCNCKLLGLCLYAPGLKQAYIPVNHVDYKTKEKISGQLSEDVIKSELERVISANTRIIMHYATFDLQVLKHTCNIELPVYWDTMIAARLLDENEKSAGLKQQYIDKIDPEQEKYNINYLFEKLRYEIIDPDVFAYYATTDALMTDRLYEWQANKFKNPDLAKVYKLFMNVEMPLAITVTKMEYRGVKVNYELNRRLSAKYHNMLSICDKKIEEELAAMAPKINAWKMTPEANEKPKKYATAKDESKPKDKLEKSFPEVDKITGKRYKFNKSKAEQLQDPINLASPTQLAILFYDVLKCPQVSIKSPRGTGEGEMESLAKATNLKICGMIVERRGIVKLVSTYIDNIPELLKLWPDGRLRTHFKQLGADTGRFSSGGKVKFMGEDDVEKVVSGVNLQNIPTHCKEIRMQYQGDNIEELKELESDNSVVLFKSTEVLVNDKWVRADKLKIGDIINFDDGGEPLAVEYICANESGSHFRIFFPED